MGIGILISLGLLMGAGGFIRKDRLAIYLSCAGIVFILIGGGVTGFLEEEGFIEIREGQNINEFYIEDDIKKELGFSLYLDKFSVEYYPQSHTIKKYKASISIIDGNKLEKKGIIEVNQPLSYKGYKIYQYGYDEDIPQQTLLQIVKDPGAKIVYLGYFLIIFGIIFSLKEIFLSFPLSGHNKSINTAIGAIVFICIVFAIAFFRRVTFPLVPALQSKWLLFHVGSCFVAYSSFALAFIISIFNIFKKKNNDILKSLTHKCICLGFLFLTIGIVLGSLWGKAAWGHWWNWDPKETWALATWIIYGVYFYAWMLNRKWQIKVVSWFGIVGFLLVLFNYFGVTFLMKGLHSYG